MTWFAAKEHCMRKGGKLVEIDSEEENTALVDEINRRGYKKKEMHFWIGLTDLEKGGDWRLASNGLKPSYLHWHEGEPNGKGSKQQCARVRVGPKPFWKDTWSDISCNVETVRNWNHDQGQYYPAFSLHALCEFDASKEDTTSDGTTTEGAATEGLSTKSQT